MNGNWQQQQQKIKQKLARQYFEAEAYDQMLDFVTQFQGQDRRRFREAEFEAHYRLGMQRCANDDFSQARQHFSAAVQLANTPSQKRLCQGRLATLNQLILNPSPPLPDSIKDRKHTCPNCNPDKTFYDCAVCEYIQAIHHVQKLPPEALQPQIEAVYAVGAYRRWWDRAHRNPYSQAVESAQRPQSEILLEPLGVLLADFIAHGEAAHLREKVDFICPVPAPGSAKDAWRNYALSLIGQVISRRFGIPLFEVLTATGRRKNRSRLRQTTPKNGPFHLSDPDLVAGRRVLLLDDIATYRRNIQQAGASLQAVGAQSVYAVILAYTESSHC